MSRIHVKPAADAELEPDYDDLGYFGTDTSNGDSNGRKLFTLDYSQPSSSQPPVERNVTKGTELNKKQENKNAVPEDPPVDYDDNSVIALAAVAVVGAGALAGSSNNGYLANESRDEIKSESIRIRRHISNSLPPTDENEVLREKQPRHSLNTGDVAVNIGEGATVIVTTDGSILESDGIQHRPNRWKKAREVYDVDGAIQQGKRVSGLSRWKKERAKDWRRFKTVTSETLDSLQVWQGSFKQIEGRFGSPVLAYFRFLKWLFLLNLLLALLVIGVIILPQASMGPSSFHETINTTSSSKFIQGAKECTADYAVYNKSESVIIPILDFVQGTGWMERTPVFYGFYYNRTYRNIIGGGTVHYNMSVAYLLTVFAYFIISLFLMVHLTAKGMKSRIVSSQSQLYLTCNKVFVGWDFSLSDLEATQFKHIQLAREYMRDLAVRRRKEELKNQSLAKKMCVILIRLLINFIVIGILVASGYLIYYMSTESIKWLSDGAVQNSAFLKLLVEYSPPLTMTALNFVVPSIFQKLVLVEDYNPTFEIKITIFRSVTLRLSSIAVLLVGVGGKILGCDDKDTERCRSCETVSLCWETYIGQQFYKLVLLDFVTVVLMTFLIQFPRRCLVKSVEKSENKVLKLLKYQEFEIPKEVLDIVYSQTLCWIGSFLSPIVLCMTVVKFFIFFYVKKLSLMYNCQPSTRLYRASSSQTFFISILLIAFVLCAIPVAFAIGKIPPSYSCGPFRVYSREAYFMFNAMTDLVDTWPAWFQQILAVVANWTFYVPLIVVVCLITYYFVSIAAGKREYIKVLLQQLSVATKDKQFLVHEALKRRQAKSD